MSEEKKIPKPSVETLNEFDELCKKSQDPQLTSEQYQEVINHVNEIIETYNLDNYVFTDPATGKKGVKNPAGQVLIPAKYEDFTFVGDHNVFPLPHMAAKKDGKYGVVAADGTGTVLCDFLFDLLLWSPFTGLYEACWDGVKGKFGFVNKEGKVFIPNVLTKEYEPWTDFMLLESDGKFGALEASLNASYLGMELNIGIFAVVRLILCHVGIDNLCILAMGHYRQRTFLEYCLERLVVVYKHISG